MSRTVAAPATTYRILAAREVIALAVLLVAGVVFSANDLGTALECFAMSYIFMRDWHGALALRGRLDWIRRARTRRRRFLVACAIVCLYPLLAYVYLYFAARDAWAWHKSEPARTRARIKELEIELGFRQPGEPDDGGE